MSGTFSTIRTQDFFFFLRILFLSANSLFQLKVLNPSLLSAYFPES